ncbi:hypothetical protein Tco_1418918 [Tanacetum coccineum]
MYQRTGGFIGHKREVYKSLVTRLFHEGRVVDFLENEPNLHNTFAAIGFDCLLDIDEQICPIFVLQFYKSVRLIRNLNGTLSIAFVIDNVEIVLTLENFARILKISGKGVNFKHVQTTHPYPLPNDFHLVNHVMIPLSIKRVFRFKSKGKRPRLPTPTPSNSGSDSPPTPNTNQGVENDLVDNYTLEPIPYLNQLPPIEGGESPEFKQTKGLFKCFFHYLCKKK